MGMQGLWPELVHLVTRQRSLAMSLVTLEIGKALWVWGSDCGKAKRDTSESEFERRHGDAGWFETDRPRRANTRIEKIMLWLGFEKY